MKWMEQLRNLLEEPPPAYAFEIGPEGIAHWQAGAVRFEALPAGEWQQDGAALAEVLGQLTPAPVGKRRRAAAVLLPDQAARVSLLEFDQFPRRAEEQVALLRFRLKRTVPFDVDTAVVKYHARTVGGNKTEVTVAAMAVEALAPYETAFRNAGFHAGYIQLGALSAVNLAEEDSLVVRWNGQTLTMVYLEGAQVRLYRAVDLPGAAMEEVLNLLDPTLAYLEDERKQKPARVSLCGLGSVGAELTEHLRVNWGLEAGPLRSRLGAVDARNAGLYGYLEGMGVQ